MIKVYQDGENILKIDDGAVSVESGQAKGNVFVHDGNVEMIVHLKRGHTSLIKSGNHVALIQFETARARNVWLAEHPDWKEDKRLS